MKGHTVKTPERVALAIEMRDQGFLLREIADHFDIGISTADQWVRDPNGTALKARRERYKGTCQECGGPTNGNDGPPPPVCAQCHLWTVDGCIQAVIDWTDTTGVTPRCADALRSGGALPVQQTAAKLFGTWNGMLLAAGMPLVCDRRRETSEAMAQLRRDGLSLAEIAHRFGCTSANVWQRTTRLDVAA